MLDIGRPFIIDTAHLAGIKGTLETWAPMVLGTSALSLIDLTTGYISFASGGLAAQPYTVLEIRRSNGDVLYERDKDTGVTPHRVFPEDTVAELNTMLNAVVRQGTGKRADLAFEPTAGKTGTNQGYRDAWFIGFTGNNVAGVWLGNDDFTPMKEVTGGLLPAPIWRRIMMEAERGEQPSGFAGVPYDDTYKLAAAQAPQPIAPETVSDETDQAQGADTENQQADASTTGDVNGVLNGMFDLFEATPPARPAATAAAKPAPQKQQALVLPKANVAPDQQSNLSGRKKSRNFLDQLFGGGDSQSQPADTSKPKKKKKKTLFDSIF